MSRFYLVISLLWLANIFRGVLRLTLAQAGVLEWEGWKFAPLDFWPSYVTAWEAVMLPFAIFLTVMYWRQIEWKQESA